MRIFRKKNRKQNDNQEKEGENIVILRGGYSGCYAEENDQDIDPEENNPHMRKVGSSFVIPSK